MIEKPLLPEGWISEDSGINGILRHTTITAPLKHCKVFVTVDWSARCFRGGRAINGYLKLGGNYAGRGWQQRLVTDAVKWLEDVVNS